MIFSNISVSAKEKELQFGKIYQICVGEEGRGRREIRLACPENTILKQGCNFDYTIGLTKNGRPRINKQKDNKTYFLLSSEGQYTRRGNGWIGGWINNSGQYKCLAVGNGADGAAGRIGQWDCLLLELTNEMPENDWIRVRTGGGGYGTSPQWISVSTRGIYLFKDTDDAQVFADEMDFEFPTFDEYDIEKTFNNLNK